MTQLAVAKTLALIPGFDPAIADAAPLPGGRTSRNFRAVISGASYVVRIGVGNAAQLSVRRADEYAAFRAASQAGIAPEIYWADVERGIMVSRFIEGQHWSPAEIRKGSKLRQLVEMLRRAHGLKVDAAAFDPIAIGIDLKDKCPAWAMPKEIDQSWPSRLLTIQSRAKLICSRCLCHNDIGRANFIDDGKRLWLIDWECAGIGDPFYDLAIIAHNNRLTVEEEANVIQAYLGESPDTAHVEHLARMKVAHDFYHVFWYALMTSVCETALEYRLGREFHTNRLAVELASFAPDGSFIALT